MAKRMLMRLTTLLVALASLQFPARAVEQVDLILVLAADVSRSVDAQKFKLQREGYAQAIANPQAVRAMLNGQHKKIALQFVEWSAAQEQKVVIDWTLIASTADAEAFSAKVLAAERPFFSRTAIGPAIDFSMAQLGRSPYGAERRVIDISGDGTHNHGREVTMARDEAIAKGVVINGIAILSAVPLAINPGHTHPPGGLLKYYEDNVIGGPGAFALSAESFEEFGPAFLKKLIREVAEAETRPGG